MPRSDFEKLRVYQLAEMLADFIWDVVIKSIGKQQGGKVQTTPDRITEKNSDDN